MQGFYTKVRCEEVAPEMRAAAAKACAGLDFGRFVQDLDRDVCAEASEALGVEQGADARVWRHRVRAAHELPIPAAVLPIRDDFWFLMGRRAPALKLSNHRKRGVVSWGPSFRTALKLYRNVEPNKVVQSREREVAVSSAPSKFVRCA